MKRTSNLTRMTKTVGYENSRGFVSYEKACDIIEACLDTMNKFNISPAKCPAAHDSISFLRNGFGFAADFKAHYGMSKVFRYACEEKVMTPAGQRSLEILVRSIDDYLNSNRQVVKNDYRKQ